MKIQEVELEVLGDLLRYLGDPNRAAYESETVKNRNKYDKAINKYAKVLKSRYSTLYESVKPDAS